MGVEEDLGNHAVRPRLRVAAEAKKKIEMEKNGSISRRSGKKCKGASIFEWGEVTSVDKSAS